jgi:uncharacterized LabA/DUF88 family protein
MGKGVDVALGMDIISEPHAHEEAFDCIVVTTGDGDPAAPLEAARARRNVWVVPVRKALPQELNGVVEQVRCRGVQAVWQCCGSPQIT